MQGGDKILCDDDNDHRLVIKSIYDVYYDKSHGHPEHAIWYFLEQNEF
jgi:hypothetical protein